MRTTYKTRAWWLATALGIAESDGVGHPYRDPDADAINIHNAMAAAMAPDGDPRLVIKYRASYDAQAGEFECSFPPPAKKGEV